MAERQEGRVAAVNRVRGRIAVELETGGYSVADLLGDADVERGDTLEGELRTHGNTVWHSMRTGRALPVYVEVYDAGGENVRQLLR